MSNSPGQIPIAIHPAIRNLNVRQIAKIIATKIIETTALQLQFNTIFCNQLDVAQHLNSYEAVAYFVDQQFFERYGFNQLELINVSTIYDEVLSDFQKKFGIKKLSSYLN
ncbi:hypothetical protein [Acinetobacter sp. WCHAc060025]|uniref:hypothetical protein n=1 Tax=Acinetobacter sp. WCHAc060025 TaxID=2518625 RepID=UPI0010230A86|nr:hypothetical protein [Acinetobacter sp. WCHAc060025]RZG77809.1 hypothetical protein EXE09_02505 [Acinetobacter sp. WCHAc060025]